MIGMFSLLLIFGQFGPSTEGPAASISSLGHRKERISNRAITILYDNNRFGSRLKAAWGFSCLVEGWERTILFDTGGDNAVLLDNIRQLGVDPKKIDAVVLSHIHGDHTGGIGGILAQNRDAVVYMPASFPERFKKALWSFQMRVEEVSGMRNICKDVFTTGEFGKGIVEQSLVLRTARGLIVITGCAHPGVVRIVRAAREMGGADRVYLVLGGFHLAGEPASRIRDILKEFRALPVEKVAPCHCSGDGTRLLFEEEYGADYIGAGVGMRISLREEAD